MRPASSRDGIITVITALAAQTIGKGWGTPPSAKLPDAAALPEVPYGLFAPSDPKQLEKAEDLQRLLNMFPGISLKVDGIVGPRTAAAYKTVTGKYLPGDPLSK